MTKPVWQPITLFRPTFKDSAIWSIPGVKILLANGEITDKYQLVEGFLEVVVHLPDMEATTTNRYRISLLAGLQDWILITQYMILNHKEQLQIQ